MSRNILIAGVGFLMLQVGGWLILFPITAIAASNSWGLTEFLPAGWPRTLGTLILLDYTLYLWHVLNHKIGFLWRFHLVHHIDLDLDASTALRFHFGEHLLSISWRSAQVILIGVSVEVLALWQSLVLAEILFHHANIKLPLRLERTLNLFVVTPRMHGIHHSMIARETNSNFSSGLTLWDRLHRTLRLNIPQGQLTIGVPAYQTPSELTSRFVLKVPFRVQRDDWRSVGGVVRDTTRDFDPSITRMEG